MLRNAVKLYHGLGFIGKSSKRFWAFSNHGNYSPLFTKYLSDDSSLSVESYKSPFLSKDLNIVQILDQIPSDSKSLTTIDIINIFRAINDADRLKSQTETNDSNEIKNHEKFVTLCQATIVKAKYLRSEEAVSILGTISKLKIPLENIFVQAILKQILKESPNLSLEDIFFLDFLIQKRVVGHDPKKSDSFKKLQLVLPMLFQINLQDKINHENVAELLMMLSFIVNNFDAISRKMVVSITTSLRFHGADITKEDAMQTLCLLAQIRNMPSHFEPLLKNIIQALCNSQLTERDVIIILSDILRFNLDSAFFDQKFFEKCANIIVENNVPLIETLSILGKLNKLKYNNANLMNYIWNEVDKYPDINKLSCFHLFAFINAFDHMENKPTNWNEKIGPLAKKMNFSEHFKRSQNFNWLQLPIKLNKLGAWDLSLAENILNANYIEKAKRQTPELFRELKTIYQSHVKHNESQLENTLAEFFGGERVLTSIKTKNEKVIPCVLKIDRETQKLKIFNESDRCMAKIAVESIERNKDEILVAIVANDGEHTNHQSFIPHDFLTISINLIEWSKLSEWGKMQKIFSNIEIALNKRERNTLLTNDESN